MVSSRGRGDREAGSGRVRLDAEHLAAIRPAGPAQWSADGRHVAFAWPDRGGLPYLWVWSAEDARCARLTDRPIATEMDDGTDRRDIGGGPQWSPREPQVAFLSRASARAATNIWTIDLHGHLTEITDHVSDDRTPRWSPDGGRIAFVGYRDGRDDIQVVPSGGGTALQLTYDRWDNTDLDWSPDGRSIAFVSQRSDVDLFSNVLCVVAADGSDPRQLTRSETANDRSPRWSPDGRTIAFVSDRDGNDDIWLVRSDGSDLRRLTAGPGAKGDPRWSPDGARIAHTRTRACEIDVCVTTVEDGTTDAIASGGVNTATRWSPDGRSLLYLRSGPAAPPDLWIQPLEDRPGVEPRRVTNVAGDNLAGMRFSEPRVVRYRSPDGLEIEGLYYAPTERTEGRAPGMVWVHGGSNAFQANGWEPLIQYLAQRGYAILAPNYRGSTGHGRGFMRANMGDRTGDDLQDWVAAAAWLRERREVDPERIAIAGRSWGGYATLLSLGRSPETFQAGVAIAAPSNWETYWDHTRLAWTRRFRVKLMGPPAPNIHVYRRQSPVRYAEAFRAPVLILHGEDDPGVPSTQAREMSEALARAGKGHECRIYEGEGHSFAGADAIVDSTRRIERFLSEALALAAIPA